MQAAQSDPAQRPHGLHGPWDSPGQNTGGQLFPSPGDLPHPGTEPRSPALQVDSLPAKPPQKPQRPVMCDKFRKIRRPLNVREMGLNLT